MHGGGHGVRLAAPGVRTTLEAGSRSVEGAAATPPMARRRAAMTKLPVGPGTACAAALRRPGARPRVLVAADGRSIQPLTNSNIRQHAFEGGGISWSSGGESCALKALWTAVAGAHARLLPPRPCELRAGNRGLPEFFRRLATLRMPAQRVPRGQGLPPVSRAVARFCCTAIDNES